MHPQRDARPHPLDDRLRAAVAARDAGEGYVTVNWAGGRVSGGIIKSLAGQADFDIEASLFGGTIDLSGLLGISAEVVDLRCLRPLDLDTLFASVNKTRRLLVVDEGWRTGSLAGEICAQVAEHCFWSLDAPPQRLCSAEVPIPYPRHLELAATPQVEGIVAAAVRVVGK